MEEAVLAMFRSAAPTGKAEAPAREFLTFRLGRRATASRS